MERSGSERVLMGSRMFDAARTIVIDSLPATSSEIEFKRLFCERMYGSEVDLTGFVEHLRSIQSNNNETD